MNLKRMVLSIFAILFFPLIGLSQESNDSDLRVGTDKAYFLDGDSVTFSGNPSELEFSTLGLWYGSDLTINFTDPSTVIFGFAGGTKQVKGTWSLDGDRITCSLQSIGIEFPSSVGAIINQAQLDVEGYGILTKKH